MHFQKWLCGPYISSNDVKKIKRSPPLEKIDSSTKHDLLSMEEYKLVTVTKELDNQIE